MRIKANSVVLNYNHNFVYNPIRSLPRKVLLCAVVILSQAKVDISSFIKVFHKYLSTDLSLWLKMSSHSSW